MHFKQISICCLLSASALLAACGGTTDTPSNGSANNSTAGNSANGNSITVRGTDPTAVSTPEPTQIINNASTIAPVYKAYCAALVKKDDAALRKVLAAATIADLEAQMKEDGTKNMWEVFETDPKPSDPCEARNETFLGNGNTAVVEVTAKWAPPQGAKLQFEKEGGEWKLTNKVPAFDKK